MSFRRWAFNADRQEVDPGECTVHCLPNGAFPTVDTTASSASFQWGITQVNYRSGSASDFWKNLNVNKAEPTLALKPRDVTRNPETGVEVAPKNRTCECVSPKKLLKKFHLNKKMQLPFYFSLP